MSTNKMYHQLILNKPFSISSSTLLSAYYVIWYSYSHLNGSLMYEVVDNTTN